MYIVKLTTTFKKSYKLMRKRGLDMAAIDSVIDTLMQGKQLAEKYRDHALTGCWQDLGNAILSRIGCLFI